MKIWLRIGIANLTHARTAMGMSISYDELAVALNRMGIECRQEYPKGNYPDATQYQPENPGDWLEMWYADPRLWEIDRFAPRRGLVCYSRCGECDLVAYDIMGKCDMAFVASSSGHNYHVNNTELMVDTPFGIISGGVDTTLFPFQEIDFSQDPFIFLSIGATQWRKGTDVACRAFSEAFPSSDNVRLKVISPGETEMFVALRDQYKGDSRISFECRLIENRPDVQSVYYAGHCLLYTSYLEGWGRNLAEAMLTGLPAIVTKQSSMLDQFSADCGWWVETQDEVIDVGDLGCRMQYAYEHRDACKAKGRWARQFAINNLTWESGIGKALPPLNAIYRTQDFGVKHIDASPCQLNIGCHVTPLENWLNLDLRARALRGRFAYRGGEIPEIYRFDLREQFAIPANSVDAITISQVLVFVTDAEAVHCIRECYRVLKPGGIIRLTEVDEDHFYFPGLFSTYTPEKMLSVVADAGFRADIVAQDETSYHDESICVDLHGDPPKVFFVEGIK